MECWCPSGPTLIGCQEVPTAHPCLITRSVTPSNRSVRSFISPFVRPIHSSVLPPPPAGHRRSPLQSLPPGLIGTPSLCCPSLRWPHLLHLARDRAGQHSGHRVHLLVLDIVVHGSVVAADSSPAVSSTSQENYLHTFVYPPPISWAIVRTGRSKPRPSDHRLHLDKITSRTASLHPHFAITPVKWSHGRVGPSYPSPVPQPISTTAVHRGSSEDEVQHHRSPAKFRPTTPSRRTEAERNESG